MQRIKILILIIALLSLNKGTLSQNINSDSILLEIEKAEGEAKLELIYQYSLLYENDKKLFNIANWLEKEALAQKNNKFLANSYMHKARCFILESNLDSLLYYSSLVDELAANNDRIKNASFLVHYYIATAYINKGYYDLAIHVNLQHKVYRLLV